MTLVSMNGAELSTPKFTNKMLMTLWIEVEKNERGWLGFFLGNRFAAFKKANLMQYRKINAELLEIQRRYCVMEIGEGQSLKTAEVIKMEVNNKGALAPVMLPDKTLEDYLAEQELFLQKKCSIVRPRPMDY